MPKFGKMLQAIAFWIIMDQKKILEFLWDIAVGRTVKAEAAGSSPVTDPIVQLSSFFIH